MNNGNNSSQNERKLGDNSELIAIANRRRKEAELNRLQHTEVTAPPDAPKQIQRTRPKPSNNQDVRYNSPVKEPVKRPAPRKSASSAPEKAKEADQLKREAELKLKREELMRLQSQKQRRIEEEQKLKKEEEKRIERDKKAAQKRIAIKEGTDKISEALSSLRKSYKGTLKNALGYFIIFVCVFLIICTVSATVFLISIMNYADNPPKPTYVTINAGGKDKEYAYEDVVRDGVCYVNFTAIADICDFSLSGDKDTVIYSTRGGEQIKFTTPSRTVFVNGNSVTLAAGEVIRMGSANDIWLPADFVQLYLIGLSVDVLDGIDEKTGEPYLTLTVSRIEDGDGLAEIGFLLKHNDVLSGISNESLPEEPVTLPEGAPVYEFASDLSYYLKYMCPADFDKHMILINPSHAVDETHTPEDMVSVPNPYYDNMLLSRDASLSLEALFLEMHTLGFKDMKVSTAYRSFETQKKQFDNYVYSERYYYGINFETTGKWFSDTAYKVLGQTYLETKYISQNKKSLTADDAKRVAMSYSAYPGTSDHQSGLSVDLYLSGFKGQKFVESDEYKWLVENAHKFGFIFRYPEGKENITGYAFEPYHLRFVGQYHAAIIYETGLTLDEYVAKYIN